ncbi:MAG: glycosyltransferase [Gammaproteobacteria bacterium]|nr:glycosyltransferase [Gammaproteobacteria bacterium]
MKIALVLQTLGKGGAERVASLLSQQFERDGHEVHILLWEKVQHYPHGGTLTVLNTPATSSLMGKLFNLLKRAWLLRQWHKAHQPDLLISLMETANIPAVLSGVPVVISVHLDPRFELASYQRLLMKWLYPLPNVKARVAVSHGIAKVLETDFGIKDWQVIANPVDLVDIAQQKTLPRTPEIPTLQGDYILGIGRLHPQKGFDLLIDAYEQSALCRVKPLVILGEGDSRADLEAQIAAHGLQNWIYLPGWANNPFPWFAGAWVFVMSSRSEGLGNTLIEAMACGCSCISADCDFGPRDIITHEVDGLLVPAESSKALSQAFDRLVMHEDLRRSLQRGAMRRAEDYDLPLIARQWANQQDLML